VAADFNVSRTESILLLTLYTLGLAFGPVVIAPLSEYFGRKWIYVTTSSFLLAFTGGAAAAQNFTTLLVCRFLAGFLGSAGVAIWAFGKVGGIVSLFFILGPFLGPSFGPLAGAYILYNHDKDWRWTQYLLLMIGAPILFGTVLMRETSKQGILQSAGRKAISGPSQPTLFGKMIQAAMVRPVRMLCTETVVRLLTLYTAFAYAMVFSYFGSASYVLQLDYGFSLREVGLNFISVIIGYILALFMSIVF
jgi:MFS family permease